MRIHALILSLGMAAAMPATAGAQTATDLNSQVTTMNNVTANQGQSHVIGKIGSDFSSFLGSDATAVVTGLRNGTPIMLTSTTPSTTPGGLPVTTTTVITPPTGQMGFGNVYISLALAQQQLSMMGITQPTPEQLQAALTGGTIEYTNATGGTATADLQGILTMRNEGMGWGQIAQAQGVKLGPVMSAMKSGNKSVTVSSTAASTKGSVNATVAGKTESSPKGGIVSASGKTQGSPSAAASAGNKGGNSGIVSASGRTGGNAFGQGNSGIVTGAGRSAGAVGGIVSAGGSGNSAGRGKGPAR
jgi:hypothetical protein